MTSNHLAGVVGGGIQLSPIDWQLQQQMMGAIPGIQPVTLAGPHLPPPYTENVYSNSPEVKASPPDFNNGAVGGAENKGFDSDYDTIKHVALDEFSADNDKFSEFMDNSNEARYASHIDKS